MLAPARSYLINASRGQVVDLASLAEAIRSGRVAGAAVDVYPTEPEANSDGFVTGAHSPRALSLHRPCWLMPWRAVASVQMFEQCSSLGPKCCSVNLLGQNSSSLVPGLCRKLPTESPCQCASFEAMTKDQYCSCGQHCYAMIAYALSSYPRQDPALLAL